jgi:spore germination protein GerM
MSADAVTRRAVSRHAMRGVTGAAPDGRRRRRAGRAALAVGLLVALAAVAGCGIPNDSKARPIDREALPSQLVSSPTTTTPTSPGSPDEQVTLYLVASAGDAERLVPVPTDIGSVADSSELPRRAIEALIAQQPKANGGADDETNAIPPTVQVQGATVTDGVLELDLSDLGSVELTRQRLAAAQIVFTATALPGIDSVRFVIDGQPGAVPLDDQASAAGQAITRQDYPSLLRTL